MNIHGKVQDNRKIEKKLIVRNGLGLGRPTGNRVKRSLCQHCSRAVYWHSKRGRGSPYKIQRSMENDRKEVQLRWMNQKEGPRTEIV